MLGFFLCSIVWMVLSLSIFGAIAAGGDTVPVITENSVYKLDLEGVVTERSKENPFESAMLEAMGQPGQQNIGLDDILANIKKAKNNEKIIGIHLEGGNLSGGYATMKEIRDALVDFKTSGKFITSYADSYMQSSYYLATTADKLMVNTKGVVDWRGLSSEIMYYTDLLEKVGAEMQIVKVGTFKSAVEPYINTEMSDANRLQMQQMVDGVWGNMLTEVSSGRKMNPEQMDAYADEMMTFQATEKYKNYNMVDTLVYANEVDSILKTIAKLDAESEINFVSHSDLCKIKEEEKFQKDKIAVIYAEGAITDLEGDGIVGEEMVETINEVSENDAVKAVVFRVNSPGGSAYASEQIWNALRNLKKKKPIIVSMGDYAASGGYYISCIADTILAQPNTLTGSIGVFSMIPNLSGTMDKFGLKTDAVKTNEMSDMTSNMLMKGMNKAERAVMQKSVNEIYDLFVQRCADGRNMSTDAIREIGEGRVWLGEAGVKLGLVDMLGGIDDAIAIAARKANLTAYGIATYPEAEDMMTQLINSMNGASILDKIAQNQLGDTYLWLKKAKEMSEKTGIYAAMPYQISIE